MHPSATVSESFVVQMLWYGVLGLCFAAFFIMGIMILQRLLRNARETYESNRRKDLSRIFYGVLNTSATPASANFPELSARDRPIACHIAVDILRSTRGPGVQRVIDVIKAWGLKTYIYEILKHGRRGQRIMALTLLSHFSDEFSRKLLVKHAEEADIYVQLAALRGLAQTYSNTAVGTAVAALERSGESNTMMLADILAKFGRDSVPQLLELAKGKAVVEIRLAALKAIGAIGALDAMEPCIALCQDENAQIRNEAVTTLGKLGDLRAVDAALRCLSDPDHAVRASAAQALGSLQQPVVIPELLKHLDDSDWWVRFHAANSLYLFGDAGFAMLKLASNGSGLAKEIATQVLSERKAS